MTTLKDVEVEEMKLEDSNFDSVAFDTLEVLDLFDKFARERTKDPAEYVGILDTAYKIYERILIDLFQKERFNLEKQEREQKLQYYKGLGSPQTNASERPNTDPEDKLVDLFTRGFERARNQNKLRYGQYGLTFNWIVEHFEDIDDQVLSAFVEKYAGKPIGTDSENRELFLNTNTSSKGMMYINVGHTQK
jgi:hypothetical protein